MSRSCAFIVLLVATLTLNYATCRLLEYLYVGGLEEDQSCIKIGVVNNVEDFLNTDCASRDM